jgi:phosphoglycerate dehydrogenase-like enzyme
MADAQTGLAYKCNVLIAVDGLDCRAIVQAAQGWASVTQIRQEEPEPRYRQCLQDAHFVIGWPEVPWLKDTPVRVLQTGSAGFDDYLGFDLHHRPDFTFCNVQGVHSIGIAEHVMAMMLALCRQIPRHVVDQNAKRFANPIWDGQDNPYGELTGATACVVGLGLVGIEVAKRCAGMQMKVTAVTRSPKDTTDFVQKVYGMQDMDQALGQADHVIVCVSGGPDTSNLVDAQFLNAMKQGSFIYNVSRGSVVNESDLIAAINSGHLAGGGLDVFAEEPLGSNSPLWDLDHVILTPHMAGFASRYMNRMEALFINNLRQFRDGKPLTNVVNQLSTTDIHQMVSTS